MVVHSANSVPCTRNTIHNSFDMILFPTHIIVISTNLIHIPIDLIFLPADFVGYSCRLIGISVETIVVSPCFIVIASKLVSPSFCGVSLPKIDDVIWAVHVVEGLLVGRKGKK